MMVFYRCGVVITALLCFALGWCGVENIKREGRCGEREEAKRKNRNMSPDMDAKGKKRKGEVTRSVSKAMAGFFACLSLFVSSVGLNN